VSLTKTASKGRELKMKMIEGIREHVDEHEHIYVVSYSNMRASRFKDIRMDWRESTIYLGKVAVAMVALGRGEEDEYMENLHQVSAVRRLYPSLFMLHFLLLIVMFDLFLEPFFLQRTGWPAFHEPTQEGSCQVSESANCRLMLFISHV
jgi:hypothetical protein